MNNKSFKRKLIIATKNIGKFEEFCELLISFPVQIEISPDYLNVEEVGTSFIENARLKAIEISNITGEWTIADDSGLSVKALSGRPGIHSARYANSDLERIEKLLSELDSKPDRSAYFSSAICVAAPGNKILLEVESQCNGNISLYPRGDGGFGYDPIFEVNELRLTFAEMSNTMKLKYGHRGKAFNLLRKELIKLLDD